MCGGNIIYNEGDKVGTCESCGTKQTIPNISGEKIANMVDRANHFRLNNEYDKAQKIYEDILLENSDDAEIYWDLLLCKYGIEYVEDPKTKKRLPTINCLQYKSILSDDDYKKTIKLADSSQKSLFEEEAKYIDEVQKAILNISKKEKPYDIFICYKESDTNGRRTQDSVLAQDIYYQLTNEGYKVFFSRITLEDKLGTAYEPYIFSALNSSKIMLVVTTKQEYVNAVWVKNEWSRYLNLISNGENKTLIPAYRDMDPYDLPDEFSHLQALDMGKLGFMQDLIRGINKIINKNENDKITNDVSHNTSSHNNANESALMKRIEIFIEDGNFKSAEEYCEKVLDMDPENGKIYYYLMLIEREIKSIDEYTLETDSYGKVVLSNNYYKVQKYADKKIKDVVNEHIKNEYTKILDTICDITLSNNSIKSLKTNKDLFEIVEWKELYKNYLKKMIEDYSVYRYNLNSVYAFLSNSKDELGIEDYNELLNILYEKIYDVSDDYYNDNQYDIALIYFSRIEDYKDTKQKMSEIRLKLKIARNKKIGKVLIVSAIVLFIIVMVKIFESMM